MKKLPRSDKMPTDTYPVAILNLNNPSLTIAVTMEEAQELGAFEETALSEQDAKEASEREG
ncbi:hypothetical protein [Thiolapillus sp.]